MATIRKVLLPPVRSKNFTLAEARAVFREIKRERERQAAKKAPSRPKRAAKAG
jgi:hypothetical protein